MNALIYFITNYYNKIVLKKCWWIIFRSMIRSVACSKKNGDNEIELKTLRAAAGLTFYFLGKFHYL